MNNHFYFIDACVCESNQEKKAVALDIISYFKNFSLDLHKFLLIAIHFDKFKFFGIQIRDFKPVLTLNNQEQHRFQFKENIRKIFHWHCFLDYLKSFFVSVQTTLMIAQFRFNLTKNEKEEKKPKKNFYKTTTIFLKTTFVIFRNCITSAVSLLLFFFFFFSRAVDFSDCVIGRNLPISKFIHAS